MYTKEKLKNMTKMSSNKNQYYTVIVQSYSFYLETAT